jgi:fumarate reductase iron-sulfur subunit
MADDRRASRNIELDVLRYDPETDEKPWFQRYSVPAINEWCVLDALNYVKDNIDPTLAYRWSCHMQVCGSCGMMVDGEPKLACKAMVRDYVGAIRIEPLAHFPIERDLVSVADEFMEKLERVKPYLIPAEPRSLERGPYTQTPAQLNRYQQYAMCINCMLCYAACPQVGLHPKFIGPAAISLAHRYNLDSRDAGRQERQEEVATAEGVWECTFVGACSEVCPKHVDPAAALQQVKVASTLDWYVERFVPWGKK